MMVVAMAEVIALPAEEEPLGYSKGTPVWPTLSQVISWRPLPTALPACQASAVAEADPVLSHLPVAESNPVNTQRASQFGVVLATMAVPAELRPMVCAVNCPDQVLGK